MFVAADLMQQCAPAISPVLMHALVRTESAWQPLAIGMDSKQGAVKQPTSIDEAVATATALAAAGRRFSVGLAQIHMSNIALNGLSWKQAFDPCTNLSLGQKILWNFYHRASASGYSGVAAVWAALRGYNSGGVNRAISDDYANRIFAYMSTTPPSTQRAPFAIHQQRPELKSSLATPLLQFAPPEQQAAIHRPGESLDIFEKDAERAGL